MHVGQVPAEIEKLLTQTAEETRLEKHQVQRSVLADTLNLKVGPPNGMITLADTSHVKAYDDIGLLYIQFRGKKNCSTCYGGGVMTLVTQSASNEPDGRRYVNRKGVTTTRTATMCNCVKRQYDKARDTYAAALCSAGLATPVGFERGTGIRLCKLV